MSTDGDRESNDISLLFGSRGRVIGTVATSGLTRPLLAILVLLGALAALFAIQPATAQAQSSDAQTLEVDCSGDPEVVTVLNGATATDFTGWSLVSDPVGEQSFDLTTVGELAAGVSVNVQSGPGATGSLVWSQEEVLRDDDPTDFARLRDDTGATIDEVACGEATPTPTAAPTSSPGDVPNGGGPLAPSSEPLTILFTGAGLSAAAVVLVVLTLAPMAAIRGLIPGRGAAAGANEPEVDVTSKPSKRRSADIPGSLLLITGLGAALILLLLTAALGARRRQSSRNPQ